MSDQDFSALRKAGGSFVATADSWDAYRAWCREQVCEGCGVPAYPAGSDVRDRQWLTETECMDCFYKRAKSHV